MLEYLLEKYIQAMIQLKDKIESAKKELTLTEAKYDSMFNQTRKIFFPIIGSKIWRNCELSRDFQEKFKKSWNLANQNYDWVDLTHVKIEVLQATCDRSEEVPQKILGELMDYIIFYQLWSH